MMLNALTPFAFASCLLQTIVAAPAPPLTPDHNSVEKRDGYGDILSSLQGIQPTGTPSDIGAASSALSSIINATPTPANLFETIGNIAKAGLSANNPKDLIGFANGVLTGQNSEINVNLRSPPTKVFPQASNSDVPYSQTESQLRSAIYIPPGFKYGAGAQPAILVPGTGDTGYTTFVGNYIPLLQNSKLADPVWLNIPGYLLGDAQVHAEYVAYAINYISGISQQKKIAVIAWSQGNIVSQWAYKYWPSTRSKVTDQIAFSPDYHGTVLADLVSLPGEPLPPAFLQQKYNSQFINTLRSNGGDSAYVPTTNVYSAFFDEIVQPQQGMAASAYLLDARNVGVSNNEVQSVCSGRAAGSFYTHEGTLYNPLGYALLVDALTHDGPGKASRINLSTVCNDYITPGLDLTDFLLTENSILIAGISTLLYPFKLFTEPAIKSYAL